MKNNRWEKEKAQSFKRLLEDLEIGYLDVDILPVLLEFFARPKSFTSSSCSGRIVVMDAEYPWIKEETNIIFKKHTSISVDELLSTIKKPYKYRLWFRVQGPIYHVYVADTSEAEAVLNAARSAGFKHSGIIVYEKETILLELRTGIEMSIPIVDKKVKYIDENSIEALVSLANSMLSEAKKRNQRLLEALKTIRPDELWKPILENEVARKIIKQ